MNLFSIILFELLSIENGSFSLLLSEIKEKEKENDNKLTK